MFLLPFVGLLLLACTPDPDALLREGDLPGAAAAWEKIHGEAIDLDHDAAQILARRAARDPSIDTRTVATTVAAMRLLDAAPRFGAEPLDLSFESFSRLFQGSTTALVPPVFLVVGRSFIASDQDPNVGGPLPFWGGVLLGHRSFPGDDLAAFGASLDRDPPARVVTVVVTDQTGSLALFVSRKDGAWWTLSASDAEAGARYILAMESQQDGSTPPRRGLHPR